MLSGNADSFGNDCDVEELRDLSPDAAAEQIADHFSAISCSYLPVQLGRLPSYLPAPPPPRVTEYDVYNKLKKMKNTRATFPIDLPFKLRQQYSSMPYF